MSCWPWFSPVYRPLAAQAWTKTIIPSGCAVDSRGNIPCSPESIRAKAEAWLAKNYPQVLAQIGGRLSLDVYTFARYMHSEVGSGTVEERVAVGEAAYNRSRRWNRSIYNMLTPSGFYGPIHAPDAYCESLGYDCTNKSRVCCAPYKRWASTARDPSIMSLLLASLVVSGGSGDFTNGADDQAGPQAWIKQGQAKLTNYVKYLANNGKFWAGPIPGIDHWHTFLTITPDAVTRSVMGKQLLQRGIDALTLPRRPPEWPPESEVCGKPLLSRRATSFLVTMAGIAAGTLAGHFIAERYVR